MNIHDDIEYNTATQLHTRKISDEQLNQFEAHASEILSALGLDLNTPATKDTPRRFIKAFFDATEGYDGDPKLLKVFDTECRGEPDCRLRRVYCSRKHHRNFEADSPGTALLEALCSTGTDRPPDCRRAGNDAAFPRRGSVSGSASSLHRNARGKRDGAKNAYHFVARSLCRGSSSLI